jgi:hypothetical protein
MNLRPVSLFLVAFHMKTTQSFPVLYKLRFVNLPDSVIILLLHRPAADS